MSRVPLHWENQSPRFFLALHSHAFFQRYPHPLTSPRVKIHRRVKNTDLYANETNSLTFIGPCIANIYAEYIQQDATFHNLFISVRRSTCFSRFFPSIIRSSKLHIQRQVFVRPILLPAASLARLAAGSSIGLTNN